MSKQEPVAWVSDLEMLRKFIAPRTVTLYPIEMKYTSPLDTHPQRRLSRNEIYKVAEKHQSKSYGYIPRGSLAHFVNAIMDAMSNNDNTDDEQ